MMQPLRSYQTRIVDEISATNSIVLLPTGAGKTAIAATVMRLKANTHAGKKQLFLVPTRLLVEQQAQALREWTQLRIGEYHGDLKVPQTFDILVSTPKAYDTARIQGHPHLAFPSFSLIVFDEVHHVLKDHPYRKIASKLKSCALAPQILGLTASLTYAVGHQQVIAGFKAVCHDLNIAHLASAADNELQAAGYLGGHQGSIAEVRLATNVDRPTEQLTQDRKPHLMVKTFFDRVKSKRCTSFSSRLHSVIVSMETSVQTLLPSFATPLPHRPVRDWGKTAYDASRSTRDKALKEKLLSLVHWYEALRVIVVSWEEAEDLAVSYLRMSAQDATQLSKIWPDQPSLQAFWRGVQPSYPRLDNLKEVLEEKILQYGQGFRAIVFVHQRVTTHILAHVLASWTKTNPVLQTVCLYSASAPATPTLSISASAGLANIAKFTSGEANVLISTSVSEEGMDVRAANCVLDFDAPNNAVSYVQQRGRARQENSSFVMLDQRADRPATHLAAVEKQQLDLALSFKPTGSSEADVEAEKNAQRSRERNASDVLSPARGAPLASLNLYCKKTKVDLGEDVVKVADGQWRCEMAYVSVLRAANVSVEAGTKKDARQAAAEKMLVALRNE